MKHTKCLLLIIVLAAASFTTFLSLKAYASPVYWPHRIPSVTPSIDPEHCQQEWGNVKRVAEPRLFCITYGSKIDYATSGFGAYIRYKSQEAFTALNLSGPERGKLLPGTDNFIYHHYDSLDGGSLYYIKNFSESIYEHWTGNRWTDDLLDISPDETAYAIMPGNAERNSWNIKSFAVSNNYRYLVAQSVSGYIYKVDLQSKVVTRVHDLNFEGSLVAWDTYRDGKALAISNDGRIVFMGKYGYFLDTQGCGERIYSEDEWYTSYLTNCPAIDMAGDLRIVQNPLTPPAKVAINEAYFAGDSYDIDVSQLPGYLEDGFVWRRISFGAIGQQHYAFGLKYLALGDSFSSGEGDVGKRPDGTLYYRQGTDVKGNGDDRPTEKCHVSERSYPYKLAAGMGLAPHVTSGAGQWGSVACSGAKTIDMTNEDDRSGAYMGQNNNGSPRLQGSDSYERLKTQALDSMIPGRNKQIEYVRKYKPQVATLTAGGNDVEFEKIIRACASPVAISGGEWTSTCSYAKDDGKKVYVAKNIIDVQQKLANLYKELLDAGHPDMKLYVLGYPVFVDHNASNLKCGLNVRLNNAEREMIVESTRFLNQIIMLAAKEAGAMYVNTDDSLGNHTLCGSSPNKGVNGITGLVNSNESFHPNELGHSLMALSVWDATRGESLTTYQCSDSSYIACPDFQHREPVVPEYFEQASQNQGKIMYGENLARDIFTLGTSFTLTLLDYMHGANQPFYILLYSDRTELGSYTTNSAGGFTGQFEIAASIKHC